MEGINRDRRALGWRALSVVAALILAACGSQLPAPTPSSPAAETAPESAAATASAPEPAPSASQPSDLPAWSAEAMPPPEVTGFGGVYPTGIAAGGPGYVAVGSEGPCCADASYDDDPWQTVIWTSVDGRSWNLVPDLDSFGKSGLNAIATDASGTMVAVGYDVLPPTAEEPMHLFRKRANAWRSTNGIDWIRMDGLEADELRDVAATPRGWVMAGAVGGDPALFSTADGSAWTTVTFGGRGSMERVAVSDDGTTVAIGCIAPDDETACHSKAFASTDDVTWAEADARMNFVRDVAWWRGAFFAVGSNDDSTAAQAWTSPDGLEWNEGPDALRSVAGNITVVVGDGDRLIGAGSRLSGDPPNDRPSIWQTADGVTWEPVAQLADAQGATSGQATALFATEDALLVMGNAFVGVGGKPYLWIGED